jgi:hypothetical protein
MIAQITTVENLLHGNNVFMIPHFQRAYSWGERQWERLWSDLLALPDHAPSRMHFIGPLVCASAPVVAGESLNQFEVIDGQQRLTTLSALFGAMRDVARELGSEDDAAGITEDLLIHHRRHDDLRYRLVPRAADRVVWQRLVDGREATDTHGSLVDDAWEWFRDQVRSIARRDGIDAVKRLRAKAGQRLAFVSISISDENPYRVFESLNTSGLALTEFDLVRNHLFMRVPIGEQERFDEVSWSTFERIWTNALGGKQRSGWSKAATTFLRQFLMTRVGYFPKGETFLQFKAWADGLAVTPAAIIERLLAPARLAADMRALEDLRDSRQQGSDGADWPTDARRRALLRFAFCDTASAKPVIFELVARRDAGEIDEATLLLCLNDLVSLLIRRAVTEATSRQYDRRFVDIARHLDAPVRDSLHAHFHRLGWPSDAAFSAALIHHPIYRTDSLKARLILEELERATDAREHVQFSRLQIEHVLPQKLTGKSGAEWKAMLGDDWRTDHERFVHTLGNLTLTGYNQVLSNHSFATKRETLVKSKLALNEHFQRRQKWNADSIQERAVKLAALLTSRFEVVGEPNADDITDDAADAAEGLLRADSNRAFWQRVVDGIEAVAPSLSAGIPTSLQYMVLPSEYRSFRLVPWIDRREDSIGVMASFTGASGDRLFASVRADLPAIEERFGGRLSERARIQRSGAPRFMVTQRGAGLGSPAGDARAVEWLAATSVRLRDAVQPSLEAAGALRRYTADNDTNSLRVEWYTQLLDAARAKLPLHATRSPNDSSTIGASAGVRGVEYCYSVSMDQSGVFLYLGATKSDRNLAKRRFEFLLAHRSTINRHLPDLEWSNSDASRSCRITLTVDGGYRSPRADWPTIQSRCIAAMMALYEAMQPLIESEEFKRA